MSVIEFTSEKIELDSGVIYFADYDSVSLSKLYLKLTFEADGKFSRISCFRFFPSVENLALAINATSKK